MKLDLSSGFDSIYKLEVGLHRIKEIVINLDRSVDKNGEIYYSLIKIKVLSERDYYVRDFDKDQIIGCDEFMKDLLTNKCDEIPKDFFAKEMVIKYDEYHSYLISRIYVTNQSNQQYNILTNYSFR